MNVSDTLNAAADLIEERGWARGNCGMAVNGPYCLEGALGAAMGVGSHPFGQRKLVSTDPERGTPLYDYYDVERSAAYRAVMEYLAHHNVAGAWEWNDHGASGSAEVIEVLRATAVIEAAREAELAVSA